MITLATSSEVIYTLTISVLFLTVLILALLTVLKIPVLVRGFFVKNENNSLCPGLRLAAIFVQPTTW